MKIDMVELKRLVRDPLNLRGVEVDPAALAVLLEDIKVRKLLVPLLGRRLDDGRIGIIDGGQRLWCLGQLGEERAPVVIMEGEITSERILLEEFSIDLQHKPLNAIEQSDGLAAIQKATGCSVTELAAKIRKSQPWTWGTLSLQKLDRPIQDMVRAAQLSRDQAITIATKASGAAEQHTMLKDLQGLTRDQRRRRVQQRGDGENVKASCVRLAMPGKMLVTLRGPEFSMDTLIEVLLEAAKHVRKALSYGHDVASVQRYLRETVKVKTAK